MTKSYNLMTSNLTVNEMVYALNDTSSERISDYIGELTLQLSKQKRLTHEYAITSIVLRASYNVLVERGLVSWS